jgi:parallel beta-helix repeat protein
MSLLIELLIVIMLLGPAQSLDIYDSSEYSVDHNALSLISVNSSNLSPIHITRILENAREETAGKRSRFSGSSKFLFVNNSGNVDYKSLNNFKQTNIALNLKNRTNISTWTLNAQIVQPAYPNSDRINPNYSRYSNLTVWKSNKMDEIKFTNPRSKPKAIVHKGESIQAAVDAAIVGNIIEINSGTYDEGLLINKSLTIRGVDVGGGLPIIDANGLGNAIEISADQVILEGIAVTNTSRYGRNPGAGVLLSYSNNCSIEGIVSYNNYYGISLEDSSNNTISRNNISDSEYGVRIYYSNNNTLEKSVVEKTINPLKIVSSEDNLIQGNIFRDNSNEVKTSDKNKIINNKEFFVEDDNASIKGVIPHAEPTPPQLPTIDYEEQQSHKSSDSDGDGGKWVPYVAPADKGEEYENFAQKAAGTLVFDPPKNMTNGTDEWIDARIGLENTTRLVQGLLGKGDVQFRNISVATNMTYIVKLEGDSGFKISAKRPEAQILGTDPAVWLWLVTPVKGGNHTLILSVDLQLEKPPYSCRCVNVTYWPVTVKVLEPSHQQWLTGAMRSSYSMIAGGVAFMASLFSLIVLFRQLKKKG